MKAEETPASSESLLLSDLEQPGASTRLKTNETYAHRSTAQSSIRGYRLRRFYTRAIVGVFVPAIVTAYFFAIWSLILKRENDVIKYGLPGENWLFYSWFVVGVFGLNVSRYSLLGLEAAMLQEDFWQVDNAMVLLMHCGETWSGPGGWIKGLSRVWTKEKRITRRLWFTLALLSFFPFAAMPLSGLTMEISDGYVKVPESPMGVGRTYDNYNQRSAVELFTRAINKWKAGSPPTIPGIGIAYTPPHVDRQEHTYLTDLPNSLHFSLDNGTTDFFLAPQAKVPINGEAWGLRIGCNCSIMKSASELTILNQKPTSRRIALNESWESQSPTGDADPVLALKTPTDDMIYISNSSTMERNVFGYVEAGFSPPFQHNKSDSTSDGAPRTQVLEYVVWQVHQFGEQEPKDLVFNYTIDASLSGIGHPVILEADGTLSYNQSFLSALDPDGEPFAYGALHPLIIHQTSLPDGIDPVAPPVGIRCVRTSALGHAKVNAQGSYTSFTETGSPLPESELPRSALLFGDISAMILQGRFTEHLKAANSEMPGAAGAQDFLRGFIQSRTFLQSAVQAHAFDALQLMYDGQEYSDQAAHALDNATSSQKSKVIVGGAVPFPLPATLFVLWAIGSAILGSLYGFRRRWSERLDGYSMFRFGADFADEIRDQPHFFSTRGFEECNALRTLPGLVGDSRRDMDVGHISLVRRGNLANKRKLYT